MANVGKNGGRRLRLALSRFAAMLIAEARFLSRFSPGGVSAKPLAYEALDALLFAEHENPKKPDPITSGSYAYSKFPPGKRARAPNAAFIQQLEVRVAEFVGRPSHLVVIENNALISQDFSYAELNAGVPLPGLDLRDFDASDFQLGYQHGWPTFRQLTQSFSGLPSMPPLFDAYAWQYARVWESGLLGDRRLMLRDLGLADDTTLREMIKVAVEKQVAIRRQLPFYVKYPAGNLPETRSQT